MMEHSSEILCIAKSPLGDSFATGDASGNVLVWNVDTMAIEATIKFRAAARLVKFSPNARILAVLYGGENDDGPVCEELATIEWQNGTRCIGSSATNSPATLDMMWVSSSCIVTVGKKHVTFWKNCHKNPDPHQGLFSSSPKIRDSVCIQTALCVCFAPWNPSERILTGMGDGCVYEWDVLTRRIVDSHKVENVAITVLQDANDGETFFLGGESSVKRLDKDYTPVDIVEVASNVRAITHTNASRLIAGLANNRIVTVMLNGSKEIKELVQSNEGERTIAVAAHPTQQKFACVSSDNRLTVWDIDTKAEYASAVASKATAICMGERPAEKAAGNAAAAISGPKETLIVVGDADGAIFIFELNQRAKIDGTNPLNEIVISAKPESILNQGVSALQCSADGSYVAVGYDDGTVHVFSVEQQKFDEHALVGHRYAVTSIDWAEPDVSTDSAEEGKWYPLITFTTFALVPKLN